MPHRWTAPAILLLAASSVLANPGSRLWATGGVTTIEGSAGGGLTPWALLSGYASSGEWGGIVNLSSTRVDDYSLEVQAAGVSFDHRVELTFARQRFKLDTLGGELEQDVFGAKFRLLGDAVYTPYGQWSLGLQHKRQRDFDLPNAVGAEDDSGTDVYLTGSKLFLNAIAGRNLLLNAGVRATRANQTGLLGFGGDQGDSYEAVAEASAGLFLNRQWLVGSEYRQKPDNLGFAKEDDWKDVFVAYIPTRELAVTAAWVDLGNIAGLKDQTGFYLALQGAF
ncbi:DUF3034 family protein [Marinobacteraceae bacterium S3BR75-40.1]